MPKGANQYGLISRAMSKIMAKPVKGVGGVIADSLLGKKLKKSLAKSSTGIGRRMRAVGVKSITPGKALELRLNPKTRNQVTKIKGPNGKSYWVRNTYRPGGLAGVAAKYPLPTAAIGGAAAALAHAKSKSSPSHVVNVYNSDRSQPQRQAWG